MKNVHPWIRQTAKDILRMIAFVAGALSMAFIIGRIATISPQHAMSDGELKVASFIDLPGFVDDNKPELKVHLREWLKNDLRTYIEQGDHPLPYELRHPVEQELAVGRVLKTYRDYKGFDLQFEQGHWILLKPAHQESNFSLSSLYRVTPWRSDDFCEKINAEIRERAKAKAEAQHQKYQKFQQ